MVQKNVCTNMLSCSFGSFFPSIVLLLLIGLPSVAVHASLLSSLGFTVNVSSLIKSCTEKDPNRLRYLPSWSVSRDPNRDQLYFEGTERSMLHNGTTRWFLEHRPDTIDDVVDDTVPLLIILHHGRGNMWNSLGFNRYTEKDPYLRLAWSYRYLVLAPNGCSKRRFFRGLNTKGKMQDWDDLLGGGLSNTGADDVGYIMSLIDWAVAERNVNPRRVYVTGISNGGMLTQRLVLERPGVFAAAASVSAILPVGAAPFPDQGTPILIMNGSLDTRVPWYGGAVTENRGIARSAEDTLNFFLLVNNVTANPIVSTLPDLDPTDNCRVISRYYSHPTTPVQFYELDGGGHFALGPAIPRFAAYCAFEATMGNFCYDAQGAQLIWDFMTQFELPEKP
jgi:polyhydroxybutyrate depolymerase